jgi:hypothetical protein
MAYYSMIIYNINDLWHKSKLAGIFDLIESDEENTLVIVELKTSSKRFSDDQIDLDLQGTLYSTRKKGVSP